MNIELVSIDKIIPYARNQRKHSEDQVKKIASSIREFGFKNPVIVDKDMSIIAGHGRCLAAEKLGLDKVPVIVADDLNEAQVKAYRLADNRLQDLSEFDMDLVSLELEELQGLDFDLSITGFDLEDIASEPIEGLTDEDEVPEAPEEPTTKLGDIWLLGNHRVMCGDSTDAEQVAKLMDGQKADMVFTDPPYGVNYEGGHFHSGDVKIKRKREKLKNDASEDIYSRVIPVICQFCEGPVYTWYADSKPLALYSSVYQFGEIHALIIWHKTNAKYAAMNAQYKQRHEPCLYWKPKGKNLKWCGPTNEATVWEIKRDAKNDYHPTQKPTALAERAISNHKAGNCLDLFLGSGSTLIACEKTGRTCYGMELDPVYCDVIVKRWEDFTGKKAVLSEA